MNWSGWISFFNFWKNISSDNGIKGFNPHQGNGRNLYPRNHNSKKSLKKKNKNRAGRKARKSNRK